VQNYFNYFTEVEECFRRQRGTPGLLSPLDWALIESWKDAGIPLEAVLLGIERTFAKHAKHPPRFRKINSVGYCSQEILRAANDFNLAQRTPPGGGRGETAGPPFNADAIVEYVSTNAALTREASEAAARQGASVLAQDLNTATADLAAIRDEVITAAEKGELVSSLQDIETRLAAVEEKISAALTRAASTELITGLKREIDRGIAPFRQRMTGPQVESLARQYLKKALLDQYGLPRLSLFYL
jgi:hypothetical protein